MNYYNLLNINQKASQNRIYKQFCRKAFPLHPEKSADKKDRNKFRLYCEAYYILGHKAYRQIYDNSLAGTHPSEFEKEYCDRLISDAKEYALACEQKGYKQLKKEVRDEAQREMSLFGQICYMAYELFDEIF